MSTGQLAIRLSSPNWGSPSETLAMAEVTGASRTDITEPSVKVPLGINDVPQQISLAAGSYLVRLYLPSGDVQAERIEVRSGGFAELTFEIGKSSLEWFGLATSLGSVNPPPRPRIVQSREKASPRPAPTRFLTHLKSATPNLFDFNSVRFQNSSSRLFLLQEHNTNKLEHVSGPKRVAQTKGWRYVSCVDPVRDFPEGRLSPSKLVRWWTGGTLEPPVRLKLAQYDERGAWLLLPASAEMSFGKVRAFANIRAPNGATYHAVFPEGWASTSRSRLGEIVQPSVRVTEVTDIAMAFKDSQATPSTWRYAPEIDDVEAMSLLGFLHTGLVEAGQMMLKLAHTWLFEKTVNPVAAAAGAFMLLSHTEEANAQLSPHWRHWVRNLYHYYPDIPDGAIAMAQMTLAYGESGHDEEVDVEKLREYALEAVRRGLPFLGTGVRRLTDVLVALEGDDRAEGRSGPQVESTRRALSLVLQLGRITVPGEFFTVLRLSEARR